ncbi:hypothetical protein [Mesorhizobium caraganae]|uniref:hypothetical protein n=1 Tax=Mesorhizobium caraganae TaxID=483206 RepID=UPI003ECD8025
MSEGSSLDLKGYADAAETIYRLLKQIFADIYDMADVGSKAKRNAIRKGAAAFRFEPDYFRQVLSQIGAGHVANGSLDQIGGMLGESAASINAIVQSLRRQHRKLIEGRLGAEYWNEFEDNIVSLKMQIRQDLHDLASMRNESPEAIAAKATQILAKVERFNINLARFLDTIVPPTRPAAA